MVLSTHAILTTIMAWRVTYVVKIWKYRERANNVSTKPLYSSTAEATYKCQVMTENLK